MPALQLGIRVNLAQFLVQTLLVFFVGITVGLERSILPVMARDEFGIASASIVLSFVVSFGFVKAALNLYGGWLSERWGRRPVLIMGWLAALPIPPMIIWATNWWWIVGANILMGVNQGLAWSMTVTAKMDLVGPRWRGLATGINEFAGYSGVAAGALVTGLIAGAYGLRPTPFYFGLAIIVVALGIAVGLAKETKAFAALEAQQERNGPPSRYGEATEPCTGGPGFREIFRLASWRDRAMSAASQAGLVHKFADALVWVSFPLLFASRGLDVGSIGVIVGAYGFTWGGMQLITGPLTDRVGRKWPIVAGLFLVAAGAAVVPQFNSYGAWLATAGMMGLGMALLYPTLLAVIGDVSDPCWRGTSLGVYRMWRDSGYAFGALAIGAISDTLGFSYGFYFTALALVLSGAVVAVRMYETAPARRKTAAA